MSIKEEMIKSYLKERKVLQEEIDKLNNQKAFMDGRLYQVEENIKVMETLLMPKIKED